MQMTDWKYRVLFSLKKKKKKNVDFSLLSASVVTGHVRVNASFLKLFIKARESVSL